MAKEIKQSAQKGELIVKNKKFKKSDIFLFGVCLVVALIIWIYATNVEINDNKDLESGSGEPQASQQA